ncbi:MAG: DUF2867 domain-containing protein [Pseudomonadaceae bacterium]|nr:DUF2867 domain-containing protein [Pseudomonadaceae bacterium]
MKSSVSKIAVPPASAIVRELPGAYFHDCYAVTLDAAGGSALQIYLNAVGNTPRWVNALMALRNWLVALVGLKNLGHLGALTAGKPASSYRVGDRVGIFTLLVLTENEIILGDSDRHLRVQVSVSKLAQMPPHSVAVATVVHVHNRLGRVYMLLVAPIHRLIAPAMLARLG